MLDDWTKKRLLGAGSFGEVWLVENAAGLRGVLKEFPAEFAEIRDRASHELLQIRHPNLQRTLELGASYVITEFVEGRTLHDILAGRGKLPPDEVRSLGIALARGLEFLHARAMVHRDVKPENVLVPESGDFSQAILIDLGLLGRRESAKAQSKTMTGALVGTPVYMAPEQLRGEGLTDRADLWALGVVLYEASTGRRPFAGESFLQIAAAILEAEVSFADVPPSLWKGIGWSLQKDPEARVPSATQLADALASGAEGQSWGKPLGTVPAASEAVFTSLPRESSATTRSRRRRPGWALLAGLAIVILPLLVFGAQAVGVGRLAIPIVVGLSSGCAVALFLYWMMRRPARAANCARGRAAGEKRVTQSIALTVEALSKRYRKNPHLELMTQSLALVFEKFEAINTSDPQAQLDLTLKALDAMMKLEERIAEMGAPWYLRYDKPVAIITALGTAFVTWWGLGHTVLHAAQPNSARLFIGCPESAIEATTRVRLEAAGEQSLEWSLDGTTLLMGRTLEWPNDTQLPVRPGAYAIWGKLGERRERCTLEVRRAAAAASGSPAR
jgi:hypothetical protein